MTETLYYTLSDSFPAATNLRGADSQSAASAFQPTFFSFVAPAVFRGTAPFDMAPYNRNNIRLKCFYDRSISISWVSPESG